MGNQAAKVRSHFIATVLGSVGVACYSESLEPWVVTIVLSSDRGIQVSV